MNLTEIKNNLHEQIERSDEQLLNLMYAFVKNHKQTPYTIDSDRVKMIKEERNQHIAGTSISYSCEEVKKMAINNRVFIPN